jgi:hypothetical protein
MATTSYARGLGAQRLIEPETLRQRAAQFRAVASAAPFGHEEIIKRLLAAAADLDAKALELEDGA